MVLWHLNLLPKYLSINAEQDVTLQQVRSSPKKIRLQTKACLSMLPSCVFKKGYRELFAPAGHPVTVTDKCYDHIALYS